MSYYTLTQKQYPSIEGDESVNLSQLETFYKKNVSDEKDDHPYYIVLVGSSSTLKFADPAERDRAMEDLIEETKNMNKISGCSRALAGLDGVFVELTKNRLFVG